LKNWSGDKRDYGKKGRHGDAGIDKRRCSDGETRRHGDTEIIGKYFLGEE